MFVSGTEQGCHMRSNVGRQYIEMAAEGMLEGETGKQLAQV